MTTHSLIIEEETLDYRNESTTKSKKRHRCSMEESHKPEKHMKLEEATPCLNDSTKDPAELLSAYKRIWNNLDLNKAVDSKLEPFFWNKIRYYQAIIKGDFID